MDKKRERNKTLDLILKIIIIVIIILLLIHNCVLIKKGSCNKDPNIIDIDCKNGRCDALLKDLIVSPVDIDFKSDTYTYDISVDYDVEEIIINAMPFDPSTKVSIPDDLTLKDELNVFKVSATNKNGRKVTYTIYVKKARKEIKNPILRNVTTSPTKIDFRDDKYTYNIEVEKDTDKLAISVLPFDLSTKIEMPKDLTLKEGLNTFKIVATTKDGRTITYTINVNKKGKDKKVLKDIVVGPIDINFDEEVYSYNAEVENDVESITLNTIPFSSDTTVIITPTDLTLEEGVNTFKITATNKDGITKEYTISITRKGSTKVLKDIVVGPIDINFDEEVYSYDVEVEEDVDSITLNTIPFSSDTSVVITPSNLSLNVGLNTFKIEATNKSGVKKVYIINITRKEPEVGFIVKDKAIRWSESTNVEIFENSLYDIGNIIAPESSNTYRFEIKNSTLYNLSYDMDFTETNPYNINMKYKLRKNGTYLIDHYVSASELNITDQLLNIGDKDTFYLEWKWISSDNDTSIGEVGNANYMLKIDIKAENTND